MIYNVQVVNLILGMLHGIRMKTDVIYETSEVIYFVYGKLSYYMNQ